MDVGGPTKGARPVINVTPLVDVVLVLLIIFLVVTPMLLKQFSIQVPPQEETATPANDAEKQIVLRLDHRGQLTLNSEVVAVSELEGRLRRAFAARSQAVVFFDAESTTKYGDAVHIMDLARGAGATTVGIVTEPLVAEPAAGR
jgi:biopolymer transport protein ExbD/biopolymer transport protein TolR